MQDQSRDTPPPRTAGATPKTWTTFERTNILSSKVCFIPVYQDTRTCVNVALQRPDTVYLDHAGTTLYPKSLIESFSRELTSNLFGNPHSMSASSQLSTQRVDDVRLRALRFFNADPEEFDLVFVANATAAIKLVVTALQGLDDGFWYGYHVDAHTSLVGARELATRGNRCFWSDDEVDEWISELNTDQSDTTSLLAFPAQSNMNGRRLPTEWCQRTRSTNQNTGNKNVYTLLDAASLVSTSPLDLSDVSAAPDFTALSFYKIFGFPDLGALIVRKRSAHILEQRRFFGGGTVDMALTGFQWHAKAQDSIHQRLEDGTLPFHNIIALDSAFETHKNLYGSMRNVSSHCQFLAKRLYDKLSSLKHFNGLRVCHFYKHSLSDYADPSIQGPIVAFNMQNSHGGWIGKSDVERLASVKNIQLRTGFLCNPGGAASSLGWTSAELRGNYSTGLRCGDDHDILNGRPTGVIRVSLGAMTNTGDIDILLAFLDEFYVEKAPRINGFMPTVVNSSMPHSRFYIESLSVFPIKSCGTFKVPNGVRWEIKRQGLAWDREWCLVHQGTGVALNQKKYPRMALIRPFVDLDKGILRVTCGDTVTDQKSLEISLSREGTSVMSTSLCQRSSNKSSTVCGDQVDIQAYTSSSVSAFFSAFLGVPCTLARFPPQCSTRYSKLGNPSSQAKQSFNKPIMPGSFPQDLPPPEQPPILLSNESPVLLISRSSVNRLNETIKATSTRGNGTGKAVAADVFRGNIVVAEQLSQAGNEEQPYTEDNWSSVRVGPSQLQFDVLGNCQRCQMVCIDQWTGVRRDEPLSTLAKTRKIDGKILFGKHVCPVALDEFGSESSTIMVGDLVAPEYGYE